MIELHSRSFVRGENRFNAGLLRNRNVLAAPVDLVTVASGFQNRLFDVPEVHNRQGIACRAGPGNGLIDVFNRQFRGVVVINLNGMLFAVNGFDRPRQVRNRTRKQL